MISLFRVWWPALLVISILIFIYGYGQFQRYKERQENKKDSLIEQLEQKNNSLNQATKIRSKQNEVLLMDITPNDLNNILLLGRF